LDGPVSPGFTWGTSGNVPESEWRNDSNEKDRRMHNFFGAFCGAVLGSAVMAALVSVVVLYVMEPSKAAEPKEIDRGFTCSCEEGVPNIGN